MSLYSRMRNHWFTHGKNNPPRNGCISFPKSGRTWLRVMLDELGLNLQYSHAGSDHRFKQNFNQLTTDEKNNYDRYIFLYRNPLDTVVSGYHQATKRISNYQGGIHEFIQDSGHGVEKIARFNLMWLTACQSDDKSLAVSYEDLINDTGNQLKQVLLHFNHPVNEQKIANTVENNTFSKMQDKERAGIYSEKYGEILQPTDTDNINTYKVRKGKINGYLDELRKEEIEIAENILSELGYPGY